MPPLPRQSPSVGENLARRCEQAAQTVMTESAHHHLWIAASRQRLALMNPDNQSIMARYPGVRHTQQLHQVRPHPRRTPSAWFLSFAQQLPVEVRQPSSVTEEQHLRRKRNRATGVPNHSVKDHQHREKHQKLTRTSNDNRSCYAIEDSGHEEYATQVVTRNNSYVCARGGTKYSTHTLVTLESGTKLQNRHLACES